MARPVRFNNGNQKPEGDFKRSVLKYLRLAYGQHFFCLAIAGGPYQRPGSPDVVCSIRGLFVAIEFKASKDITGRKFVVGRRQQKVIDEILAAGGRAGVVSSWDELGVLIDGIEPVQKSIVMERRSNG
jgi:hypothetical protein